MIKQKRYEEILSIVNAQNAASIDDLCRELGVSKATVRRDLMYLDEQKLLKRTHGGAVSRIKPAIEDVPISLRNRMFRTEKERIAQAALSLIEDGSTVFLGSGTTTGELASQLGAFTQLTVLTNDIDIAHEIARNTQNRLIVSGGMLKLSTASLIGSFAEETLKSLQVETAFLSADAVTPNGFMDKNIDEVAVKRLMLQNARKRVMLCDQSKFSHQAFMTICPLSGVDLTITNDELDPEMERSLLDAGLTLMHA